MTIGSGLSDAIKDELRKFDDLSGLSQRVLGERLGYTGAHTAQVIRRHEDGVRPIPNLLVRVIRALQDGYHPAGWED